MSESREIAVDAVAVAVAARVDRPGASGAVWSLPHGGDLDANVVFLAAGSSVGSHVNDEVDVLMIGVEGRGQVVVTGAGERRHPLAAGRLVHVPKGAARAVEAAADSPVVYVSVHRARAGLRIGPAPSR